MYRNKMMDYSEFFLKFLFAVEEIEKKNYVFEKKFIQYGIHQEPDIQKSLKFKAR